MALFLSVRLAYLLFTCFTLLWVPPTGLALPQYPAWGGISDLLFGTFEHWDAGWILSIVHDGYSAQSAAFMPAYPALVWLVGSVTGSDLVAGVVVSVVAACIAAHFVAAIASRLLGQAVVRDTVLLVSLYPIAYVFTSAYSEGLFLAAAAASVYAAMRDRYWLAGLLAALAVSTRVLGLALVPTLVILAWPAVRRRGPWPILPLVLLPVAALAAVSLFFSIRLGDALAYSHAQSYWGRAFSTAGPVGGAWDSLHAAFDGLKVIAVAPSHGGAPEGFGHGMQYAIWNVADFAVLLAAVALTIVVFRRLGTALGVYSVGVLVISISAPVTGRQEVLQSLTRFLLVDFPLFIAAAALLDRSPRFRGLTFGSLAAVGAAACVAFSRTNWVA